MLYTLDSCYIPIQPQEGSPHFILQAFQQAQLEQKQFLQLVQHRLQISLKIRGTKKFSGGWSPCRILGNGYEQLSCKKICVTSKNRNSYKYFILHIIYMYYKILDKLAIPQLVSRYITVYHMRIWAVHVRYVTNMLLTRDILVCY